MPLPLVYDFLLHDVLGNLVAAALVALAGWVVTTCRRRAAAAARQSAATRFGPPPRPQRNDADIHAGSSAAEFPAECDPLRPRPPAL